LFVRGLYIEVEYRFLTRKHGCGMPYTNLDRPFGIPNCRRYIRAERNNIMLETHAELMEEGGRTTIRTQLNFHIMFITHDPENLKSMLATNFKDYSLGLRYWQFFPLLGNSILTLSGEGWKHSRDLLKPQFAREQVTQLDSLNLHVNKLLNIFKYKSQDGVFDAQAPFHNLTLDSAAGDFSESFSYCLEVLLNRAQSGTFYWLFNSRKFRKHLQTCKSFAEHFVHRALQAAPSEKIDGGRYVFINELIKETRDPDVIRDQVISMLLAGRDTTASLLSYIFYTLARDKRVFYKLREIVLEEFGREADSLTFESLKRCTYLSHVINEVLRLDPSVPLNYRTAIRDTILPRGGGPDESQPIFVKKDTQVLYSVWCLHRNNQLWGEDALEFRPERWDENKLHQWDYLPFNGGPRICPGQQFALTETAFTVVRILQTFKDIHITPEATNEMLHNRTTLTSCVAGGVNMSFVEDKEVNRI
jgi:cytochrome P450